MNTITALLLLLLASMAPAADSIPPGHYSLSVARVYESTLEKPEWVYIFGGTGPTRGGEIACKTPEILKTLIKGLPRGSTIDWWPTCDGDSGALVPHLEDLKQTCQEAGVTFTIHPAG